MVRSFSQSQMEQQNCLEETSHSEYQPTVRSEGFSRELHGESGESQPTESTDDAEARADFWSIQGGLIYRHHNEPQVQLYVPKEETFPIPLEYIDVTRCTHTHLDDMQEKKIDDYWNVDSCKPFSEASKRIHVAWGEIDKDSNDYQTKSCMARNLDKH